MAVSTVRQIVVLSALMVALCIPSTADAASMFTVTDLGSSYTLQQDSSGTVSSVRSGDGSQAYAFQKSPVTQISGTSTNPISDYVTTFLFQNNSYKTGYYYAYAGFSPNVPINFYYLGDWWTQGTTSPVSDINSHGQIVGQSYGGQSYGNIISNSFAAFSDVNGQSHIDSTYGVYGDNNINNYIAKDLGVYLSSAVKIDDLGDIIAKGTLNGNQQYFLLSLNGPPSPAPEPSTLAFLAVGITALGIRSAHRRHVQRMRATQPR